MDSGRDVAITGIGLAKMTRGGERPFHEIAHLAARAALEDAGLQRRDLDSVVMAGLDLECGRTISNMYTAPAAGGLLKDEIRVADDGLFAGALAWMRARAGLFDCAMVLAYGQTSETDPEYLAQLTFDPIYQRHVPLGRLGPLAMQAGAYRLAAPGADEAADQVAAQHRAAGVHNVSSLGLGAVTAAQVHGSPLAAAPLRRAHVAPPCDGAAALVFQVNPQPGQRAARIHGFGWFAESGDLGQRDLGNPRALPRAAHVAFERGGAALADVTRAELHDTTAYHHLLALEGLGFAGRGEAPQRVLKGGFGAVQINASGGSLSGEPSVASGLYRLASVAHAVRAGQRGLGLAQSFSGPAAQGACVGLVGRWGA